MARTPPRRRGTPKAPKYQSRPATGPINYFGWGGKNAYGWRPTVGPSTPNVPSVVPSTGTNPPSATPGATPGLPVDPIFSNDIGTAQRTHDTSVSGLLTQRANTAAAYGYTPTYDEQGLIRSLAVDPNSPYAKANLLRKSHTENRARTLNSMASRGQLYAGALGVGQGINDENYQQSSDALQKSFIDFIARNQGQINQTNTDYANSLAGADSERVARAVANDTGESGISAPAQKTATPRKPSKTKVSGSHRTSWGWRK
jgi:hypothetical protein